MKPPLHACLVWFAVLAALCTLAGCAQTVVDAKGFRTQANVSHVEYRRTADGAVSLVMDGVNHSTPTRAGGSVAGTIGSAVVSGMTAAAAF